MTAVLAPKGCTRSGKNASTALLRIMKLIKQKPATLYWSMPGCCAIGIYRVATDSRFARSSESAAFADLQQCPGHGNLT
jgi:hypothetical protein